MGNVTFAPGMRIMCRDAEWLVTSVDPSDDYGEHHAISCIGVDDLVRGHEAIFLTQLDTPVPVDPRDTNLVLDDSNGYALAKLYLEARLRSLPVTGTHPDLEGLGAFDPMDFQLKSVEKALDQLRTRLLLADAVGLGKTIQVGMIVTELIRRGKGKRILVLCKKSMLSQFQSELWNRFAIPLTRLDSQGISRLKRRIPASKNPFEVFQRIIMSIDTLKDIGRYRHFLDETRWDTVVIDEAHNVAGASGSSNHRAYRLAELLARRSEALLLTTATPHNGKKETFGRLISLLDPATMPDPKFQEYDREDIKDFFLMRFKEDIRDEVQMHLPMRKVMPLESTTAAASDLEEAVYTSLANLRKTTKESTKQISALAMWGVYKIFLSSPEACQKTIKNRLKTLEARDNGEEEASLLKGVSKDLNALSLADSTRFALLVKSLKEIGWDGKDKSPRVLIFTEYRETQAVLCKQIAKEFNIKHSEKSEDQSGQVIGMMHGSMADLHLMDTVEAFGTGASNMRMLVATDVASEGVNLHHQCHHIIHYDLPWSIITLIQRNGRIDRIGQTEEPIIRYLMVDTQADAIKGDKEIFDRLIKKVEEINRSTRSGESVLNLYDAEAESTYIAEQGILKGNDAVFEKAANETGEAFDLNALLESCKEEDEEAADIVTPRLRLFSDKDYFLKGYEYLAGLAKQSHTRKEDHYPAIKEQGGLLTLTPPASLKERFGRSNKPILQGATAIPDEAWSDNEQFRLTDQTHRALQAIETARNNEGHWSDELLLTEQHPVLGWINERLLMRMNKGEAPFITSDKLNKGTLAFCFAGTLSSKAGNPIHSEAHAICYAGKGEMQVRSLSDIINEAGLADLANTGRSTETGKLAAEALIHAAVPKSLDTIKANGKAYLESIVDIRRREDRRIKKWVKKRETLINKYIDESKNSKNTKKWKEDLENAKDWAKERAQELNDRYFEMANEASTQLVLVIEGVG